MRTAADKVDVASDRRRRENVPRHILCSFAATVQNLTHTFAKQPFLCYEVLNSYLLLVFNISWISDLT